MNKPMQGAPHVRHSFGGIERDVALPVTFTPFASARPCSARCTFCSETLVHDESRVLSASLRPRASYAHDLASCLRVLEGLPIGYSLSGLEATDDADWLEAVLDVLQAHGERSPVEERVLYSNGNGLSPRSTGERLIPRLASFALTRVEMSRHAVDEHDNHRIMRFHDHAHVKERAAFEEAVRFVRAGGVRVRFVCVVQKGGVASIDDARRYVAWARTLGVDDVVFRELSRTGTSYRANNALRLVDEARVPISTFLDALEARPVGGKHGYYYENVRCDFNGTLVTFEWSDYVGMKARHRSGVVHKLVFHANGNLCADWDPEREVLWTA
jgi:hypothetical protein